MERTDRISIVGLIALFGVFIVLAAGYGLSSVPPSPSLLGAISGYGLTAALAALWVLPAFGRSGPQANREWFKTIHRVLGIAFVVLLAVHARSIGHAMLLYLMALVLVIALLALTHSHAQATNSRRVLAAWWVIHLGLATAISVMALLHIYAQYAYATGS